MKLSIQEWTFISFVFKNVFTLMLLIILEFSFESSAIRFLKYSFSMLLSCLEVALILIV